MYCAAVIMIVRVVCLSFLIFGVRAQKLPVAINTWSFLDANKAAAEALIGGKSYLDAIERGCTEAELDESITSVGFGGSPNEEGETTLDAMLMDGETHDVGAVGCLKNIKNAISVARNVMERTTETFLVGDDATKFAKSMGFQNESLTTDYSRKVHEDWVTNNCQPNFWIPGTVFPDPAFTCGPYSPASHKTPFHRRSYKQNPPPVNKHNHDTIGVVVVDVQGRVGCGTTTNGLTHKIAGRVGDSPIAGAGCYAEKGVGGAAATGDGDVMMRFLPTYLVVQSMAAGNSPTDAARAALDKISTYYPTFSGALIAVSVTGEFGAAYKNLEQGFPYVVYNPDLGQSTLFYAATNM